MIASYGEQLLEWLQKYTFPTEAKFGDPAHARLAVACFVRRCLQVSQLHPEKPGILW